MQCKGRFSPASFKDTPLVDKWGVDGISGTLDGIFMKCLVFAIYVKIFWVGHIIVTMATMISLATGV